MLKRSLILVFMAACTGTEPAKDAVVDGGAPESNCHASCGWGTSNPCWGLFIGCTLYQGPNRCWIENNGCQVDQEVCAAVCTGKCGFEDPLTHYCTP